MQLDFFSESSTNQLNLEQTSATSSTTTSATSFDISTLGQVFTPECVVEAMLRLRRNHGRVLEPSCGDGAFSNRVRDCVAIELDNTHAPPYSLCIDFFAFPESEQFETIIGNPPYVRYQDIRAETKALIKSKLFDARSNLYLFFIEKAVRHLAPGGELIFITPRDFMKTTSSVLLNQWLFESGTITDAIELGDAKVFTTAVPNCLIWRYEKGNLSHETRHCEIGNRDDLDLSLANPRWETRYFVEAAGHLMFARTKYTLHVRDVASVKVGAVSGADDIYADETHGNLDFVCSETVKTGKTRRMIWVGRGDLVPECLVKHKARLISRRIRTFDESNWWHWGRGYPLVDAPRIYVNAKTRQSKPFFQHPCRNFDGAVLAIFPRNPRIDLREFCAALNAVSWGELGFVCDGRFLFSQRSLENAPLPESFRRFAESARGVT